MNFLIKERKTIMSLKEEAYWQSLEDYHTYCRMMEQDFDEEEFYSNEWMVA